VLHLGGTQGHSGHQQSSAPTTHQGTPSHNWALGGWHTRRRTRSSTLLPLGVRTQQGQWTPTASPKVRIHLWGQKVCAPPLPPHSVSPLWVSQQASGPDRQGATRCCIDCIHSQRNRLRCQLWAGPRSLGISWGWNVADPETHQASPGTKHLAEGWLQEKPQTQTPKEATALLTTGPDMASGTFNPLCKVLCILQSLYFCASGPTLVFRLVMDTHHTSNCSPKPLYSWIPAAMQWRPCHRQGVWDNIPLLWTIPGRFLVTQPATDTATDSEAHSIW